MSLTVISQVFTIYTIYGAKILCETRDGNRLIPLYDNEESVCGILYNNEPYYFQKNLQGDIIGIVDESAKVVANYSYDAWGVPTITQDSTDCGIAHINPYRYRGYYYDPEIGMYYLQSRYYDPEVGRFVNADEAEYAIAEMSTSPNEFAYCGNNPIHYVDDFGTSKRFISSLRSWRKFDNYMFNSRVFVPFTVIHNQNTFSGKYLRVGLAYFKDVGCGLLAIYNTLILLKNKKYTLAKIIRYFEQNRYILFDGTFGTDPYAIPIFFRTLRIVCVPSVTLQKPKTKKSNYYIFCYFWSTFRAHTILIEYKSNGKIIGYNVYANSKKETKFKSVNDVFKLGRRETLCKVG